VHRRRKAHRTVDDAFLGEPLELLDDVEPAPIALDGS